MRSRSRSSRKEGRRSRASRPRVRADGPARTSRRRTEEPAYYDEAPDDYVPYDGPVVESAPQELVALSADERMQLPRSASSCRFSPPLPTP